MNYKELKEFCDEKIKEHPELESKYRKEIILAKRYYDNEVDLVEYLKASKEKIEGIVSKSTPKKKETVGIMRNPSISKQKEGRS